MILDIPQWVLLYLPLIYIAVLAAFTGYEVISRVPTLLHTPLMSGSNFIHGAVLAGAMVMLGLAQNLPEQIAGFVAVLLAAANVTGGYAVTDRILEMFDRSKQPQKKKEA
ncbi:MAG: NAD(P) transhydrogenase subunit alpha [Candidatus Thermoplasmatota archaeon]|jgi:NAD(P) transhydrogenase subunit alpha|nr:NAD(P) transhydrogenase subunit alpha [Candidatus Thermoplasmatota archaeon]